MEIQIPNPKQAIIDSLIKQREVRDQILKEKAGKDLFLFNKYILKAEEGGGKVHLSGFHKELCHFVQDNRTTKKLILVPRSHLKSTLITVGYSTFRIIEDPSVRILIQNATYQTAADFVRAIKKNLRENEDLVRVFGDLTDGAEEWTENRITLKTARSAERGKESTVTGWGVESTKTGQHYDLIIHDDLVERENIGTRDQIDKVILRYKDSLDLLDPGGQLIVIGTRWIDGDLYDFILDKDNQIISSYKTFIRKAFEWEGDIKAALETGENIRSILWQEKFDLKELYTRYREKGPYEFSCQYLNEPVPTDDAIFRRDWFHYYDDDDLKHKLLNTYIAIDPAIALGTESDYTAIITGSIDQYGNVFIRDLVRQRLTPSQLIETIFLKAEMYHPQKIAIEDVAYQKVLGYNIREESQRRKRYLPIMEVNPGARTKDQRIRGLQPLYAAGKVFHSKSMPNIQYLEDELLRFPRGKNDDCIDSESYLIGLFAKPREKRQFGEGRYLY